MNKIIAVDVDLTVVEMMGPWIKWYKDKTGETIEHFENKTWHIEDLMIHHRDPLSFWKDPELYDDKFPIENSVETLSELHSLGYTIIFVSHSLPEHEDSKRNFVRRNFPFSSGFISTGDKGFVKCDIFIDDAEKYLDLMDEDVIKIQHLSVINENNPSQYNKMDWKQILEYIKGLK